MKGDEELDVIYTGESEGIPVLELVKLLLEEIHSTPEIPANEILAVGIKGHHLRISP